MDTRDTDHTPPGRDLDDETVADALDVLEDLAEWQLAAPRWERVHGILDRLAGALGAGDTAGVRAAVADLELSGPVRALRIGTADTDGIPEPVLDRRNTMLHQLGGAGHQRTETGAQPGKEAGGAGRHA
jgi:hypothetical protein